MLFGEYFYLNENKINHRRDAHTFLDVVSALGGLSQVFKTLFGIMIMYINEKLILSKLLRGTYF